MQRGLRLRAGDDGQLGVLRQPDPESATELVDDLRAGTRSHADPRRRAVATWQEAARVLAGFHDGRADEGVGAGPASLVGLEIAREQRLDGPGGRRRRARVRRAEARAAADKAEQPEPSTREPSRLDAAGATPARHPTSAGGDEQVTDTADPGPHRQLGPTRVLDARDLRGARRLRRRCARPWR